MDQKQAWEAMFSPKPPAGVDFDEAMTVLDRVEEIDPGITLAKTTQERANGFLIDPADFIASNSGDPRVPQWTRLAVPLGVIVALASAPAVAAVTAAPAAVPAAAVPTPPTPAAPVVAAGVSPSALRKSMKAAATGPSLGNVALAPTAPAGGTTTPSPKPDDSAEPKNEGKQGGGDAQSTAQPLDGDLSVIFARASDAAQADIDRRLARAVSKAATPRKRQALLDAAYAERVRRQAEDAMQRAQRAREDEERRLANLRIEAERHRLDEEAAERKRKADEEAAERKRLADLAHVAERRRLDEEAAERKRQAEQERERAEAEALKPQPSRIDVPLSPALVATLRSKPYRRYRDRTLELARRARDGDATARTALEGLVALLERHARGMSIKYQVAASAELLLWAVKAVKDGRDRTEPDWFHAHFIGP